MNFRFSVSTFLQLLVASTLTINGSFGLKNAIVSLLEILASRCSKASASSGAQENFASL